MFSARVYGARTRKDKKLIDSAAKAVDAAAG